MYKKKLENLIKISKTPKKPLEKRLIFYHNTFKKYKEWRGNFKFPKTRYLSRLDNLKPQPSNVLIKDLATCINELREEFLNLKGYKPVLLFKLFLFYFSETFKAKYKIKINKSVSGPFSRWTTGKKSPSRRDIDSIMNSIIDLFEFENFLSNQYQKFKPGYKKNPNKPPSPIDWDWAKKKNFKWNSVWKPHHKKYGHQDKFARKDHFIGDTRSLLNTDKMIKEYKILVEKNKIKDSIKIANLFYELSYCKDLKEVDKIFLEKFNKSEINNSYDDWLPLKSEIGENGKAIPWFKDNGGSYKKRVFPHFTIKNIKKRFNKEVFLEKLKSEKNIKTCLAIAFNGDPELEFAFEYDELLPERDIILPAFTSGSLFNYLNNNLTFITLYRHETIILELCESFSDCVGILLDNKTKKSFLLHYHSNRDGTTDCYLDKEIKYSNFTKDKNLQKYINKQILSRFYISPDTVILNNEYSWDINKILNKLKPLAKAKRNQELGYLSEDDDDYLEKKEGQKYTGTYIYLLKTKQINHQISIGKMDGSIRFSFPIKKGKLDLMATPKLYSGSKITLKANYFL